MHFTLTVFPDGRALLSSEMDLSPDEVQRIREVWKEWITTPDGLAIIARCQTQRAETVELDLPVEAA